MNTDKELTAAVRLLDSITEKLAGLEPQLEKVKWHLENPADTVQAIDEDLYKQLWELAVDVEIQQKMLKSTKMYLEWITSDASKLNLLIKEAPGNDY